MTCHPCPQKLSFNKLLKNCDSFMQWFSIGVFIKITTGALKIFKLLVSYFKILIYRPMEEFF